MAICGWPKSATVAETEVLSRNLLGKGTYVALRKAVSWITTVIHDRAIPTFPYGRATAGWRRRPDIDIDIDVHIPPNATATVVLPSGARHEIGSGTHHWRDTPRDSTAVSAQPLTLASTLAEIIDNPAAHHAVIAAIAATDPGRASTFRRTTRWRSGRTLHEALNKAPLPILHAVQDALATATQASDN